MGIEVETITRKRMVNRTDVAEYEAKGWKFDRNAGTQSAYVTKTEKVKAQIVPSVKKQEEKGKSKE